SPECLLLECVTGSRAYGTDTPESDLDLRGVFVTPRRAFFGLGSPDQVSDERNDETFYEIGRFVDLLTRNNPNILEMLYAPLDCVRFRHPLMDLIRPEMVLSKQCRDTFAGYAVTQVRKARGLNKKIVNPMDGPRMSVLDFCHVVEGQGSVPLQDWLAARGFRQEEIGLVKIPHMRDVFGMYRDPDRSLDYRGIIRRSDSTELNLSSIPKGETPVGWMNFNKDGFKKYCREYREYHEWLACRNEARYAANTAHGKNYDSKNLMHTFRLLDMAEEIARDHRITVRRPNRDELMRIRRGEFEYDDLIARAEEKIAVIETLFDQSDLPEVPDRKGLEAALVEIRERWYLI
ncbi:MAG: nucleotidyltransferase domain-containing protein, partial [Verrucomicrobiae bacterium]|nr:nucleotidyltransferase domain-containing protein [Verrucomicrobiae bacterium]